MSRVCRARVDGSYYRDIKILRVRCHFMWSKLSPENFIVSCIVMGILVGTEEWLYNVIQNPRVEGASSLAVCCFLKYAVIPLQSLAEIIGE